jgi:hypothetical protein
MASTYMRMIAFQYAVLRGAIAQLKSDEEGMTTLEVLVIAAGLVALAASAVVVITKVAQGKVGNIQNAPSTIISTT